MAHEIFLKTPDTADSAWLTGQLEALFEVAPVSAVLITRGALDEPGYVALARTVIPIVQNASAAALLDNAPDHVRPLKADGVHMSTGLKDLRAALETLKPDFIVGTGDLGSRHEAMLRGELGVDYLVFGDRENGDGLDMANWWAQTFEVPSVYCARSVTDPTLDAALTEFVMPGADVWDDPRALAALSERAA